MKPYPTHNPNVNLSKYLLIASTIILVFAGSAVYIYLTAIPELLFRKNYVTYEVHTMRGANEKSPLKDAFKKGNKDSVINEFNSLNSPQPEEYLLTGIAFLEKNQPTKAIETFNTLIQKNASSKTDFFEDDAEYYLAMSYLSNNQPEKAMPIFEKIQANENHPYNSNVSEWFMINVQTSIAIR